MVRQQQLLSPLLLIGGLLAGAAAGQAAITADVGTQHQRIDGFGCSEAFGRARYLRNLPAATREQIVRCPRGTPRPAPASATATPSRRRGTAAAPAPAPLGFTWARKLATTLVGAELSGSHLIQVAGDGVTPVRLGIYWVFAMWSRHVRPEARRVGLGGAPDGVVAGAFRNADGSLVVVLTNTGAGAEAVRLGFRAARAWLTDQDHTLAEAAAAGEATVSVPGRAVVTVKLTE